MPPLMILFYLLLGFLFLRGSASRSSAIPLGATQSTAGRIQVKLTSVLVVEVRILAAGCWFFFGHLHFRFGVNNFVNKPFVARFAFLREVYSGPIARTHTVVAKIDIFEIGQVLMLTRITFDGRINWGHLNLRLPRC